MVASRRDKECGFTLPVVMVVLAALLVITVGLMAMLRIERRTSRVHADLRRADLTARSALEEVRAVLVHEAADDDYLIVQSSREKALVGGGEPPPYLFIAHGGNGSGGLDFRYVPLFSSVSKPPDRSLAAPTLDGLPGGDPARFVALPWLDAVRVSWVPVSDDKGRTVARYAYWVEDLQSRVDAASAGNTKGEGGRHMRNVYPFPAAGLNPSPSVLRRDGGDAMPSLDGVALYALDPENPGAEDGSRLDQDVIAGRAALISPDSVLAAAGIRPPLPRDGNGNPVNPQARALEENTSAVVRYYDERPMVPFVEGIAPHAMGKPKKNLNVLLAAGGDPAVEEMANWIGGALPGFAGRKGGFPDDYLRTLAANVLGYAADAGTAPLVRDGVYRGLGAYPLVSEFLMRFRWDGVVVEAGRKYIHITVSTYFELWNMSDKPVHGSGRITYESQYRFPLGANPLVNLGDPLWLDDPAVVTPQLEKRGGYHWFPAQTVDLLPNQYKVFKAGEISYRMDVGPAFISVPSPIVLDHDDFLSGYRFEWNGKLVDQTRGQVHRNASTLHYPAGGARQAVRATVPGLSYYRSGFIDNMGDPRMSFYLGAAQDANAYPGNYSPNRRNIRWESIYRSDAATKPKVYGRVLPSEWPDGGHDSDYGSNAFVTNDSDLNPDDARFLANPPVPLAVDAPMRLSNRGRFYSATELGRVYDPVMWNTGVPPGAGAPWPDVGSRAVPSPDHGGGNTLRIGRPEHPMFALPGRQAARLLDLFHCGRPRSEDKAMREGPVARIEGHVNLNTATFGSLRALAAGWLGMDGKLERRISLDHELGTRMAPPTVPLRLSAPTREMEADRIAEAIIGSRPFASVSQVADARPADGRPVFGSRERYPDGESIFWSDSAAEEVFGRVYDSATLRSRNFRVWVVAQVLAPGSPSGAEPEMLAEVRKAFTVFVDPGKRGDDGSLDPARCRVLVLYENHF